MEISKREKRRSAPVVMAKLIVIIKPLLPVMLLAIILGVAGFLCAIFLTVFAAAELVSFVQTDFLFWGKAFIFPLLIILAVSRGILHYGEQYCNHFIAFKLLAIIRHKVFAALRRLCPAKLEGRDKGNLISVITSDIELLEVFYAHTISPVAIALIVSVIMCAFLGNLYGPAALIAACAYLVVGLLIPLVNSRLGSSRGFTFRNEFGDLNSFVLASLRGLDETIQYGYGAKRQKQMEEKSTYLGRIQGELNRFEALQRAFTTGAILLFSMGNFFFLFQAFSAGRIGLPELVLGSVAMMGSFGPVIALSNLSNNLNQTIASGNRVLNLLEEKPVVEELLEGRTVEFNGASVENVSFAYDKADILKDFSAAFSKGKLIGIHGESGSGKSTLLKLLMRFWDVDKGSIRIGGEDIKTLRTENLRAMQSYITQDTYIFNGTIAQNISLGADCFTQAQVEEAAKKASLHDFVVSLPKGYDTKTGELGSSLSGGERQRIGLARAFLYDAPFMLLDEPTSNLDSLNEAVILKSLKEEREKDSSKTMVLVSHRKSTLASADEIFQFQ
ncbi:MAG: ABC transporter ATP-binding protein/permease [Treponemataceae bacterium]|nr:ABC transporter ATP-binding protein/permease [Treponemataceae bacterium]